MSSRPGLISAVGLARRVHEGEPDLVVVDLRQDANDGKPKIPGSVWVSLHDGFAQVRPDRNLNYDLPTADEFAGSMRRLAIGPRSTVVLADDMGNRWATRAFWILRYFGHAGDTAVLDGGIGAYLASGEATTDDFAAPQPSDYPVPTQTDESIRVTPREILEGLDANSITLCDVRTAKEFSGEMAMSGRGGHLPGAIHVPWDACIGPDGRFRDNAELTEVLAPYLEGDRQPVTYCQGGIRASLTWFALDVLLHRNARLYAASWEEWAQDSSLPVSV
jgi:thiosulfate/3-mercaptopyruvate sulfurtransferase